MCSLRHTSMKELSVKEKEKEKETKGKVDERVTEDGGGEKKKKEEEYILGDGDESKEWRVRWGKYFDVEKKNDDVLGRREQLYEKRGKQDKRGRRALALLGRKGQLLVKVWHK